MTPDEYVEAVLDLVERIPPGRVMSYGAIADYLTERSGRASARLVGSIMARHGGPVPWHRVVTAAGRLPPGHEIEARARLRAEGAPLRGAGVDMAVAAWRPDDLPAPYATPSPAPAATPTPAPSPPLPPRRSRENSRDWRSTSGNFP